ncbi:MAG: hypothetical protein WBA44_01580 [Mesorhizobium sp.]
MNRKAIGSALLLASLPLSVAAGPMEVSQSFCEARIAGDQDRLIAMLTPTLGAIVADALERNAAIVLSSGKDAAPLQDGIPFASYPAAVRSCVAGNVAHSHNVDVVDVHYEAVDGAKWIDRLVIATGTAQIDDVLFASFPTDTYHGGLRRILADSFDQ